MSLSNPQPPPLLSLFPFLFSKHPFISFFHPIFHSSISPSLRHLWPVYRGLGVLPWGEGWPHQSLAPLDTVRRSAVSSSWLSFAGLTTDGELKQRHIELEWAAVSSVGQKGPIFLCRFALSAFFSLSLSMCPPWTKALTAGLNFLPTETSQGKS